jgi:hypothetical protein
MAESGDTTRARSVTLGCTIEWYTRNTSGSDKKEVRLLLKVGLLAVALNLRYKLRFPTAE